MRSRLWIQALLSLSCFILMWWGLSLLPWIKWLHIEEFSKKKQEQLSRLILNMHSKGGREITDAEVLPAVIALRNKICMANSIDTSEIHIHVFQKDEVNAYAIPMGHIIIYSSLIKTCDNPEMLAGVLAHEIAHIELSHISKKFAKEMVIATIAGAIGENSGILAGIIRALSSTAFDRSQEQEADTKAVLYMKKAHIDPKQMAAFFKKLSKINAAVPSQLEWISTHPNPDRRAAGILSGLDTAISYPAAIDSDAWQNMKQEL